MNYDAWLDEKIKAVVEHGLTTENAIEYIRQLAIYSGHPARRTSIEEKIRSIKNAVRTREKRQR
jgi:alkylhydroperoxidase/carboxymuconolactone decarboxylase family protein YurZ